MRTLARWRIARPGFGRGLTQGMLATALLAGLVVAAAAREPSPQRVPRKGAAKKASASDAQTLGRLLRVAGSVAMPSLKGFLADSAVRLLASNRDNELAFKPLSENRAELLSHNRPKLLADNDDNEVVFKPLSENRAELLSHNCPKLLSGNTMKVLSDIHVSVNVEIANRESASPRADGQDKIDSTFKEFDRNGDGEISRDEFRAALKASGS